MEGSGGQAGSFMSPLQTWPSRQNGVVGPATSTIYNIDEESVDWRAN